MAGILAGFAAIPADKGAAVARRIEKLAEVAEYMVPSHDPTAPQFDALRYWRGPVWLIVNYLIADGMENAGQNGVADRIRTDCLRLIETGGFAEYYGPLKGEPCGGGKFTWTAAMVIEILNTYEIAE